jgi:hypothetical protein
MAKIAEETTRNQREVEQARRELEARPPGTPLSWDEAMSYVRRLGLKMPEGWSSADIIREYRGPLPGDDSSR